MLSVMFIAKQKKIPLEQRPTEVHIIIDNIASVIQVHGSFLLGAVLGNRRCLKEISRRGAAITIILEKNALSYSVINCRRSR